MEKMNSGPVGCGAGGIHLTNAETIYAAMGTRRHSTPVTENYYALWRM